MAGLSQEERLFLELARTRGVISQAQAQVATTKAASDGSSVVETLTSAGAISFEDADGLRQALLGLSFACTRCGTQAYRASGAEIPAGTAAVCKDCAGKTRAEGSPDTTPTEMPLDPRGTVGPDPGAEPPPAPIAAGQRIGGCRIERQIGQGGMSIVYRAHHLAFERAVAVKVLDKRLVARAGFVEQFLTEARALAQLDHPNVVRFFEAARDDASGLHYLVMELLEGGSVQSAWERARRRLPVHEVVRIAVEASKGLAHAHERGLVRRLRRRDPGAEAGLRRDRDRGHAPTTWRPSRSTAFRSTRAPTSTRSGRRSSSSSAGGSRSRGSARSTSAGRRGIETFARELAARARATLATERGEVYVPAGEFRHGPAGEKAAVGFRCARELERD